MSVPDISQFQHKFRANGDAFPHTSQAKVIKRNRQALSCLPCRQRKLKCSRQQPCETCVKRNDESSCIYAKATTKSDHKSESSRAKAQDRLRQLEDLVMQMVDSDSTKDPEPSAQSPASADSEQAPDGVLTKSATSSNYVGGTHWSAILENIQDLKKDLGAESPGAYPEEDDEIDMDSDTIFGMYRMIPPVSQLLAHHLPPRLQVDRLMSVYFNARAMSFPIIHSGEFQRKYEEFWKDPASIPVHWVSCLFSICCIATKMAKIQGLPLFDSGYSASANQPDTQVFLSVSAQCLIIGGFRPRPHVVEALGLYAQCRFMESMDPSREVGLIFSIAVRLCYRMAYHRDPDNFPQLSPYEGEMRRRVWAMVRHFDLLSSFQLGLPANIAPDSWDARPPLNLKDEDFDMNTKVLPPPRPEIEPSQMLYFIVKARLMNNFGRVCAHSLSFKTTSQNEVLELDASVRETYKHVPESLRVRPMPQSFATPPYLIMLRINIEFLYQKSLLVLHRKYMLQDFQFSTKACVDSAMSIARIFSDIYRETQPGGQLHKDRWMFGSFMLTDYLLAAMVMCLAASQWRKKNPGKDIAFDSDGQALLEICRMNYQLTTAVGVGSTEAKRVADALGTMLQQLQPHQPLPKPLSPPATSSSTPQSQQSSSSPSETSFPHHRQHQRQQPQQIPLPDPSPSTNLNLDPLTLSDFFTPATLPFIPARDPDPTASMTQQQQYPTNPLSTSQHLPTGPIQYPQPTPPTQAHHHHQQQQQSYITPLSFLDTNLSDLDWTSLDQFMLNPDRFNEEALGGFNPAAVAFPSVPVFGGSHDLAFASCDMGLAPTDVGWDPTQGGGERGAWWEDDEQGNGRHSGM
jgi:hypothetical protein